jgi:diadenosine tetraphosphate (Ap4A) HIT family hydrolase
MTMGNCVKKCEFNLNQTNDNEYAAECSIAKDVSDKLKEGVSFQEYVICDNHPVQHVTHTHTHTPPNSA